MPAEEKQSRWPILLLIILLFLLANSIRSIFDLNSSIQRLDEAKARLSNLKAENQKLKADIVYAQSPEYIEKAAVEQLNMAQPGYRILILEKPKEQGDFTDNKTTESLYNPSPIELWLNVFNLEN